MGLDMYLTAKLRTYKAWDKEKPEHPIRPKLRKALGKDFFEINNIGMMEVSFEAGYWRKANQIHSWFVKNSGREDDCTPIEVERGDLMALKKLCEEALANKDKAKELLPTQSGFFFGDTSYDEYYFEELKETIEIIDKCLKLPEGWVFEYQASW